MSKNSEALSFEDLGAIYRVEKKSPTLSAVRKDMYPMMAQLIASLRLEYEDCLSVDPESVICEGVNQKRKKAISMSREIVELRMAKITSLALISSRGGQNVLDHLTSEERVFYNGVLDISRKHIEILDRLSGKKKFETPEIDAPAAEKKEPAKAAQQKAAPKEQPVQQKKAEEPPAPPKAEEEDDGLVMIRILEDLPPFSGPDRNYELSKEDIVRMPKAMAAALINREKAVLINPAP
ncbi:MAG: hypothetical protein FWC44_01855 [Methanomassiliicoccaceae archaeon]|nr:hypothetical protein [Methanomassiliicoccaceae archaeon]